MLSNNIPLTLISLAIKNGEEYALNYEIDVQTSTQFMSAQFDAGYHNLDEDERDAITEIFHKMAKHAMIVMNRAIIPDSVIARMYVSDYGKDTFAGIPDAMALIESMDIITDSMMPAKITEYNSFFENVVVSDVTLSGTQETVTISLIKRLPNCSKKFKIKVPPIYLDGEIARKTDFVSFPFYEAIKQDLESLQLIMCRWVTAGVDAQKRQLDLFDSGEYESRIEVGEHDDDNEDRVTDADFAEGMLDDEASEKLEKLNAGIFTELGGVPVNVKITRSK